MAVVSDFGTNGTCSHGPATPSFYRVGEIRAPEDSDFAYFAGLADTHEDWTLKHDRNNVRVWMKETPGQTLKMMKVNNNYVYICIRNSTVTGFPVPLYVVSRVYDVHHILLVVCILHV